MIPDIVLEEEEAYPCGLMVAAFEAARANPRGVYVNPCEYSVQESKSVSRIAQLKVLSIARFISLLSDESDHCIIH